MTKNLKVFLEANKYDPTASDLVKETVMKSSIMEAMNIELLSLYRQKNDMGWVLDQAGINFGQLAGIAYIIPGFRFAKTDMITEITKHSKSREIARNNQSLDAKTLFGAPVFKEGTKEYSLPLAAGSKMTDKNTTLPPGASWIQDTTKTITGVAGLKDNGVTTVLSPDGKYTMTYTSIPVSMIAATTEAK